jgi:hypothetical protein
MMRLHTTPALQHVFFILALHCKRGPR